jgi:hypothetical protein
LAETQAERARTRITQHERRAQLIPGFDRLLDENYIEFGYRQEEVRDALIAAKVPPSFWSDGLPGTLTDFMDSIKRIKDEEFFKDACKFHLFTDQQICELADKVAQAIREDYPEFTNRKARRRVRTIKRQSVEQTAHNLLLVGKGRKFLMATSFNCIERDQQNARNRRALENMQVRSTDGRVLKVSDLATQAQRGRASEIFCMLKGIEKLSDQQGMKWAMLTLTASPSGHPTADTYSGQSMLDSIDEIAGKLRNVQKELDRKQVRVSGCRTAEFHKDGCPHFHLVIHYHGEDRQKIIDAFGKKFTVCHKRNEHGEEGMPTCNWQDGDSKKSKSSSYAMKYVLKSMFADQQKLGPNATDKQKKAAAEFEKIDALHSTWNLRRFAFFGIGNRTTWREARKVKDIGDIPANFTITRKLIGFAQSNNAAEFIKSLGGLGIKNSKRPARISVIDRGDFREIVYKEKIRGEWDYVSSTKQKMIKIGRDGRDVERIQPNEIQGRAVILNYSRENQNQTQTAPLQAKSYDPNERFLRLIRAGAFFAGQRTDEPPDKLQKRPN